MKKRKSWHFSPRVVGASPPLYIENRLTIGECQNYLVLSINNEKTCIWFNQEVWVKNKVLEEIWLSCFKIPVRHQDLGEILLCRVILMIRDIKRDFFLKFYNRYPQILNIKMLFRKFADDFRDHFELYMITLDQYVWFLRLRNSRHPFFEADL